MLGHGELFESKTTPRLRAEFAGKMVTCDGMSRVESETFDWQTNEKKLSFALI
jgi:hypothetical protein